MALAQDRPRKDGFAVAEEMLKQIAAELELRGISVELHRLIVSARKTAKRVTLYEVRGGYVKATILSSEAAEDPSGPWAPGKELVHRNLFGEVVTTPRGVPPERSYHNVVVSEREMKCDCEFSAVESMRANQVLKSIASRRRVALKDEYFFDRYVLDKHTLYVLARALEDGSVSDSESLRRTLSLALLAFAISKRVPLSSKAEEYLVKSLG